MASDLSRCSRASTRSPCNLRNPPTKKVA
jgi:hypothetical protein